MKWKNNVPLFCNVSLLHQGLPCANVYWFSASTARQRHQQSETFNSYKSSACVWIFKHKPRQQQKQVMPQGFTTASCLVSSSRARLQPVIVGPCERAEGRTNASVDDNIFYRQVWYHSTSNNGAPFARVQCHPKSIICVPRRWLPGGTLYVRSAEVSLFFYGGHQ
eukprot:scaffold1600_cov179-Amphora_coffeaeformis.AAC.17